MMWIDEGPHKGFCAIREAEFVQAQRVMGFGESEPVELAPEVESVFGDSLVEPLQEPASGREASGALDHLKWKEKPSPKRENKPKRAKKAKKAKK